MFFHWRLSDTKSPQVSRTLLSFLAVFNNTLVWMVSTRPPTSWSSRPFNNPLVTVPKAPITIGIIVTFMFHSFFQFSSKVEVLISFHILSVLFCGQPGQQSRQFLFFFLFIIISSGLLAEIRWSFVCQSPIGVLWVSFSRTGDGLCIYHSLALSNINFLHIIIQFSAWLLVSNQPSPDLYLWLKTTEVCDSMHSMYFFFFFADFWGWYFSAILIVLS